MIFEDFGRIIKDTETVKIHTAEEKYFAGETEYKIGSIETGKIVLFSEGQDGEKIEPNRTTITFDENTLTILNATRNP